MYLQEWKFKDFKAGQGIGQKVYLPHYDDRSWFTMQAPGDVHDALMQQGIIKDPFYDRNEPLCRWVEEKTWWFRSVFTCCDRTLEKAERLVLNCYGLDTFVTLYLNGSEIGKSNNMFLRFSADISELYQPGKENCLALRIDPPQKFINKKLGWESWGRNPHRIHFRKAQFSYGWDWGPRLPGIGIWRPVEIEYRKHAAIHSFQFQTLDYSAQSDIAVVSLGVEIENLHIDQTLRIHINLRDHQDRLVIDYRDECSIQSGLSRQNFIFAIDSPALWWTHDLGTPTLYRLNIELYGHELLDAKETRVGIRTLELDQSPDPDEPGTRFFRFVLNGVPVFAKGANWIPADSFVGRLRKQRYQRLLQDAQNANMNMIRVWGGGIYEHDWFYRYCDQLGIMVWQDFMFACAMYPEEPQAFVDNVKKEAIYQVKRLRNHPCLALWCGNNENQWIHDRTFWNQPNRVPGSLFYHEMLPDVVKLYDGTTPYWPGSPYGGSDYNAAEDGDRHNWQVWHGDIPRRFGEEPKKDVSPEGVNFYHYERDRGRFISEFGMHASPVLQTLKQCMPEDQLYFHSPSMDHHNKDHPKNKGDDLLISSTGLPRDLLQYIKASMIAQAEGLKLAIEHYRRRKPHCSGALFWQFNDCWPALSWSVVDYYGFKKAGYYYAKRAFMPVLASFSVDNTAAQLWICNDTLFTFCDTATVRVLSFQGIKKFEKKVEIEVAANSTQVVDELSLQEYDPGRHYLYVESKDNRFAPNRRFLRRIQDLEFAPVNFKERWQQIDCRTLRVRLYSNTFVYFVQFQSSDASIRYSDNYFDLHPHRPCEIEIRHPLELTAEDISMQKYGSSG